MKNDTFLKPGTRIELRGSPALNVPTEAATIGRWLKVSGPREAIPGYHRVIFQDGGSLLVHQDRFRIIDNR